MANFEGFQSKYERGEHLEISKASLDELEALEKKYSSVLNGNEYAFSGKPAEEGYRIFSRLLEAVRAKISEVKSANASVSKESTASRKGLSKEIRKPLKKRAETEDAAIKTSTEIEPKEMGPDLVSIPRAPEPKSPTHTGTKKSDLDGFAGGVRSALKDMGKAVTENIGKKIP